MIVSANSGKQLLRDLGEHGGEASGVGDARRRSFGLTEEDEDLCTHINMALKGVPCICISIYIYIYIYLYIYIYIYILGAGMLSRCPVELHFIPVCNLAGPGQALF